MMGVQSSQSLSFVLFVCFCQLSGAWISLQRLRAPHTGTNMQPAAVQLEQQVNSKRSNDATSSAILKIPSDAWRWPSSWPFGSEPLEQVELPTGVAYEVGTDPAIWSAVLKHCGTIDIKRKVALLGPLAVNCQKLLDGGTGNILTLSSTAHVDMAPCSVDVVVVTSGVELVQNPQEYYRHLWTALKPGGMCFTVVSSRLNLPLGSKPVKMWTTMTDEQKIWLAGSFFRYSAYDGWENIQGFDILGKSGSETLKFDSVLSEDGDGTVYVVQATKGVPPFLDVGSVSLHNAIQARLVGLPGLSFEDGRLLSHGLATAIQTVHGQEVQARQRTPAIGLEELIFTTIPSLYKILKDVSDSSVPPVMKALLATLLFESWQNRDRQVTMLRAGLGLATGDSSASAFWAEVAPLTAHLTLRDRLYLLADIIAADFNDGNAQQFPIALQQARNVFARRLPAGTPEDTIEASAADLVLAEISVAPREQTTSGVLGARLLRYIQECSLEQLENLVVSTLGGHSTTTSKTQHPARS